MRSKGLVDKIPHRRFRKAGLLETPAAGGGFFVRTINKNPKRSNSAGELSGQQQFQEIVQSLKTVVDKDMISAVRLSHGTSLLWRDILMMAHTGTLLTYRDSDGNTWVGGRTLSNSIQNLLDSVSNAPGVIIGRSGAGWVALLPAQAGYVLTSQGKGNLPLWLPPQGGGSSGGDQAPWANLSTPLASLASTGLLPYENTSGAIFEDSPAGIKIAKSGATGHVLSSWAKDASATPYKINMLFNWAYTEGSAPGLLIGWGDDTGRYDLMLDQMPTSRFRSTWNTYNNPASFSGIGSQITSIFRWFQIEDDGTTIYMRESFDGQNWIEDFSQAKSSAFLGGDGYKKIVVAVDNYNSGTFGTLAAWNEIAG